MTSADPTVTDPLNPQGWNRYSYVGNDPLAFTDPNGYSWSSFFHSVANFFTHNPIVRAVVQIATTVLLTAVLGPAGTLASLGFSTAAAGIVAAAASAAIVTGLSGGNLGQALRAGVIAGATAFAFFEVGSATNAVAGFDPSAEHIQPGFGTDAYAFNVAGHALVGCGASVASGGSCQSGALSGAVSAGAGPLINGQRYEVALVENAVLGGVASVAGGGKFANGAVTGAFGYMFNACGADPHGCLKWGASIGTSVGIVASAGCDVGTSGVCTVANPTLVAAMGAAGAATGAAIDSVDDYVHGNSLQSQRQTVVYSLTMADELQKYGITSAGVPEDRYTAKFYAETGAQMNILATYDNRAAARIDEFSRCTGYLIYNGHLPPMSSRC